MGLAATRQPVAFVASTAPERAVAFYGEVLGLTLRERSGFALVFDDAGLTLRVQIVPKLEPAGHTVHGWVVKDIAAQIDALVAKGVVMARFDGLELDARGIWQAPGGAKIAWFTDPCGNILSLTEMAGA